MLNQIESAMMHLRKTKPLVLCLTNYVTMDFVANGLLALGAAPVMSCCEAEAQELIKIVDAVNLNIGTLDLDFIRRCKKVAELARQYNKPLVLDPVGSGASLIRTATARELMSHADIIRGNASEIMALLDDNAQTLGVESLNSTQQAKDTASKLASKLSCVVVVSGAEDFVTDGTRQESLAFGSPIMPLVTGMGCLLTAVTTAFRVVVVDSFEAARLATSYFGLCGNLSSMKANKPGTFRTAFIDELYAADFKTMKKFYIEWK